MIDVQALERSSLVPWLRYSPALMSTGREAVERDAALETLRRRVLAAARRRVREPADAEDLTQEVLLLLTTRYASVDDPVQLVALALGILRKKRADLWRKAARHGEANAEDPAELPLPHAGPGPDTLATDRERLQLFVAAASRLDGRCREILRRKILGASFVEIAAELGRPVNTVYSWDWRCHRRLRRLLGDRWSFVAGEADR